MQSILSRRDLLVSAAAAPGLGLAAAAILGIPARAVAGSGDPATPLPAGFPRQDQSLVREVVAVAHFNEKRVRELVDRHPALVNAWWDWGFGDWESPLGAASHVGNREIAEYLIQHGARIDMFAAAMLGQLDALKAILGANPGSQRTLGPHAIPLLAHAKAGGTGAAAVVEYLEGLGDANGNIRVFPVSEDEAKPYLGTYSFGSSDTDRFVIRLDKAKLMITKKDIANLRIHRVGEHEFFPAGVPSVRIRFAMKDGKAPSFEVLDPLLVVSAVRIAE